MVNDARERIISAALAAADRGDLASLTTNELLADAAVSNGSFFHHFPTKEHLVDELTQQALSSYHQTLEGTLTEEPASSVLAAFITAHLDWVITNRALARVLFTQSGLRSVSPQRQSENQRFAFTIDSWRQPRIESGELRDTSLPVFAAQLIGPAQLFCRPWLAGRNTTDPRSHATELIGCAVAALTTQGQS